MQQEQICSDDQLFPLSANYPFRLQGEVKCRADSKQDEGKEADEIMVTNETCPLLNIPFHVLEIITKFCVGVEYLNFRATCKLCRLPAPVTVFETAYPLVSPWLMVFDEHSGNISFIDPMFGDKYF